MHRPALALAVIAAATCLSAGCSSSGSSTSDAAATPSSQVEAAPSSDVGSAEPSSGIDSTDPSSTAAAVAACTSHSCLAQEAELTLPGIEAQDGSVITKATCYESSVKHTAPGIFTVRCQATYTDGSVWSGLETLQPGADQSSWQPQTEVS